MRAVEDKMKASKVPLGEVCRHRGDSFFTCMQLNPKTILEDMITRPSNRVKEYARVMTQLAVIRESVNPPEAAFLHGLANQWRDLQAVLSQSLPVAEVRCSSSLVVAPKFLHRERAHSGLSSRSIRNRCGP